MYSQIEEFSPAATHRHLDGLNHVQVLAGFLQNLLKTLVTYTP
jgi:hypothetical protein